MLPPVLEYIDAHRNCEDIAMAFLVANATGSPPVYVRAPGLQDLGQGVRKVGAAADQGSAALPADCLPPTSGLFSRQQRKQVRIM
jgi:Glycosyl transferase family 64 domain